MKNMTIPINDLKRHNHSISREINAAVDRVLSRGWYVLGPEVEAFEAEFAEYCGVDYCVGVGNGTDALELALRALEVKRGDKVATVANAGGYSSTAILNSGTFPIYVDIDDRSMNMDAESLSDNLTEDTKAIIVTHLYGQMADMPRIIDIAERKQIPVIEDCAQAHGAQINGRHAGSWGDIGCFSFYPTKNLGALGDGGAVVTSDPDLAERVRMLRQYGWASKYRSVLSGGCNSRLDELQAAILRAKLPHLDSWNDRRREVARAYKKGLSRLELVLPPSVEDNYIAHLYVVRTPYRDPLRKQLADKGISTDIHYPVPDHLQESYCKIKSAAWHLPVTERCCNEVLTLPCFPEMTDAEIERIIEAVYNSL